jgi:hypothetical protein
MEIPVKIEHEVTLPMKELYILCAVVFVGALILIVTKKIV